MLGCYQVLGCSDAIRCWDARMLSGVGILSDVGTLSDVGMLGCHRMLGCCDAIGCYQVLGCHRMLGCWMPIDVGMLTMIEAIKLQERHARGRNEVRKRKIEIKEAANTIDHTEVLMHPLKSIPELTEPSH